MEKPIRRADRATSQEDARALLNRATYGVLSSVGDDGERSGGDAAGERVCRRGEGGGGGVLSDSGGGIGEEKSVSLRGHGGSRRNSSFLCVALWAL